MRRNELLLRELQLESASAELAAHATARARTPVKRTRGIRATSAAKRRRQGQPVRRSLRVQGMTPDGAPAEPSSGPDASLFSIEPARPARPEGTIAAELWEGDDLLGRRFLSYLVRTAPKSAAGSKGKGKGSRSGTKPDALPELDQLNDAAAVVEWHAPAPPPAAASTSAASSRRAAPAAADAAYATQLSALAIGEDLVAKVVPDRTYSIVFHPCTQAPTVLVGDKGGKVGLWHVLHRPSAPSSPASASDATDDGIFMFSPHVRPVTRLLVRPGNAAQVLSCSYDGSVRVLDLGRHCFFEAYACGEDEDEGLTGLCAHPGGDVCLAATADGAVLHLDLREPRAGRTRRYDLHPRKLNAVSWNAEHPHYVATASNDTTACVWDVRRLSASKPAQARVCTVTHGKSVNAAEFSPRGTSLVTMSLDDSIRVYRDIHTHAVSSSSCPRPTATIAHNNQTGRWLTKFQPAFDPKCDAAFAVGCMRRPRAIDVFSTVTGARLRQLHDGGTYQSSVTSLHAFHPTLPMLAGCNSSGRVFVWR